MIPNIKDILSQLAEKQISLEQAEIWIAQHMQMVAQSAADVTAQRSYFAAEAMNATMTRQDASKLTQADVAESAVSIADALIAELSKEKGE